MTNRQKALIKFAEYYNDNSKTKVIDTLELLIEGVPAKEIVKRLDMSLAGVYYTKSKFKL